MGKFVRYVLIWTLAAGSTLTHGRERGLQILPKNPLDVQTPLYRRSHALVVGISEYAHWPKLANATRDAREVAYELTAHGFHVTLILNPDKKKLEEALHTFVFNHGTHTDDRLLFYFAGHGHTQKMSYGSREGFIVPLNAPLPGKNGSRFLQYGISMHAFEMNARQIQAKHVMYVFDCCFSGSVFSTLRSSVPVSISYKTSKPVRQFITAGEASETVADKSVFSCQFIEGVNGSADANQDGFITGSELGEYLQTTVINYTGGTQHPQYGKMADPQLDKGDYVFVAPQSVKITRTPGAWSQYLCNMKKELIQAHEVHTNDLVTDDIRIDTWKSFLLAYGDDCPDSNVDNRIRRFAFFKLQRLNPSEPSQLPQTDEMPNETFKEVEDVYHELMREMEGARYFFNVGSYYQAHESIAFIGINAGLRLVSDFGISVQYGISIEQDYLPRQTNPQFLLGGLVYYFKNVAVLNIQGGYLFEEHPENILNLTTHTSTYYFGMSAMFRMYKHIYAGPSVGWPSRVHSVKNLSIPNVDELSFGFGLGVGL